MQAYHEANTRASDSIRVRVSEAKLRKLQPELYEARGLRMLLSPEAM